MVKEAVKGALARVVSPLRRTAARITSQYTTGELDSRVAQENLLSFSGVAGVAIIAVIELVTLDARELDLPLTVSLYAFAVSIPALGMMIVLEAQSQRYKLRVDAWWVPATQFIGMFAAGIGVVGLFWHFSPLLALVLVTSGMVSFSVWAAWDTILVRENAALEDEEQSEQSEASES